MLSINLFFLFSYAIGILNSSYYFVRFFGKKDIRAVHSGTAGARNVGRIYGKIGFFLVFFIDFLKGYFLCWLSIFYQLEFFSEPITVGLIGVFLCILGHSYPPQLQFKGGKGVSIYMGVIFFLIIHLFYVGVIFFLIILLFFVGLILVTIGKLIKRKALLLFFTTCVINTLFFLEHPTAERLVLLLPV